MSKPILISGAEIVGEDGTLRKGDLLLEKRRIRRIAPRISARGAHVVRAKGLVASPGLIDTQLNGGWGFSFSGASAEDTFGVGRRLVEYGVTGYLPTLISLPREMIRDGLRAIREVAGLAGGAQILGIHLEGPWLAPGRNGAHQLKNLRPATLEEFEAHRAEAGGLLRKITLAPERPGALEVIEAGAKAGVIMAAGHTEATAEEFDRAVRAGVRHVTHLFNAMNPIHHRQPSLLNAALVDDRVSTGFIYDRVHVGALATKLLLRAKPRGKAVLVSDAVLALGCPSGEMTADGETYVVSKGTIRVKGTDTIAGSAQPILYGVRCLVEDLGLPLGEALYLATAAPAKLLGLKNKGVLREGADADVVLLDRGLEVAMTFVRGECVHGNHH
ncbi:MAG TPA: N-acetylglucosamine-6-phosphate deacetylase [Planctomycetota bacterium]|nr:N-acetylglucosamine-6-phosphate deacetylase [Planctomycetota bacterium]